MNTSRLSGQLSIASICTLLLCACTIPSTATPEPPAQPGAMTGATTDATTGSVTAEPAAPQASGTGSAVINERLLPSGMAEVGAANAPVSLMIFTNTACGYCRDFQEDLLPRLMNEYVRTGKLRISFAPFIVQKYETSESAALAQHCAARQSRGLAMQDLLFREAIGTAGYRAGLAVMEINQEQLTTCMEDPSARAVMESHQAVAASLGVTLIPSYTINGELHTGLPDYPDLRGAIEEVMKSEQ